MVKVDKPQGRDGSCLQDQKVERVTLQGWVRHLLLWLTDRG